MACGAVAVIAALVLVSPSPVQARSPKPSVNPSHLFACPLLGAKPRAATKRTVQNLSEVGLKVALPHWLKVKRRAPQRIDLASRSWRLSIRTTLATPKGGLKAVRVATERTELGPPHISTGCATAVLKTWVPTSSRVIRAVELGVYRRPLGLRRRAYALYATRADGRVMTAVLTGKWKSHKRSPDLRDVALIFEALLKTSLPDTKAPSWR